MIIASNISALNTLRHFNRTQNRLLGSSGRLSSGVRINQAGGDWTQVAISERIRSQVNGLNQAGRNAMAVVSMIQVADGALGKIHDILQRMRTLSMQAASETLSVGDRAAVQQELYQLVTAFQQISDNTEFNDRLLLKRYRVDDDTRCPID